MAKNKYRSQLATTALIGILVISVLGTVSTPTLAEENIFQKETYISQFGPGFIETEIASSQDN